MKKRHGFVSNSSTSSFCMFGVYLMNGAKLDSLLSPEIMTLLTAEDIAEYENYGLAELLESEALQNVMKEYGLGYHNLPEHEGVCLGRSLRNIKDDETGAQLKESVRAGILAITGNPKVVAECSTREESWRNG